MNVIQIRRLLLRHDLRVLAALSGAHEAATISGPTHTPPAGVALCDHRTRDGESDLPAARLMPYIHIYPISISVVSSGVGIKSTRASILFKRSLPIGR